MPPKPTHVKYKKCPFCGGIPKLRGANSGMYWMQCQICGAMTRETVTTQEAQDLWKSRVPTDVNLPSTQLAQDLHSACTDTISRQAALDVIRKYDFFFPQYAERFVTELRDAMKSDLVNDIKTLPSAQPQRMRGRWLDKKVIDDRKDAKIQQWQQARCSICYKWHTVPYMYYFSNYNFCPNCGADMREVDT